MVDLNATLPLLGSFSYTVKGILDIVQLLVGGIFGIYVITLIVRIIFFRKIYKSFEEIKNHVNRLENKIDNLSKRRK